jgi:ABC-type Zn2+ transport system substrate-binding protein/surface adhesin
MTTDQPIYPRMATDAHEKVHVLATHLEVQGPFHMALDPEQAQHVAVAIRKTAELADLNAEAYNEAVDALEAAERALNAWQAQWDRLVGLAKTVGLIMAIGALIAALSWLG